MDPEELRSAFEALGRGDPEPFASYLADDVVLEFPGTRFGGRFEGKRKVVVFLRQNQRLFRDGLRFAVRWAGASEDRVIAQWTNEGTTKDGRPYANRGVTVLRLAGGKVVEIQDYLDTALLERTWPN
jgi:ketosteroid isomerase-like protein